MRGVEKLIIVLLLLVAVTIPACSQKETKSGGEQPAVGAALSGWLPSPPILPMTCSSRVRGEG